MFLPLLQSRLGRGLRTLGRRQTKASLLCSPPEGMGENNCLLSVIQFVCILCTCTNPHRVNLLSAIYWCLLENDCLPSFWVLFFKTVLKYLKCIDCWLSFKNKTKPFELYYRGWHCSGMGQSFLQSFSYHLMILVQEPEIFSFLSHDS